jgi:cytochrome P450 family 110
MQTPPYVKSPSLQQLWQWTFTPLSFLDHCAAKYGDCFIAQFSRSTPPWWFFSHPDAIADIFAQSDCFDAGRVQEFLKPSMGTTSSLLLDGAAHQRRRQLLMPPFHGERLRTYGKIMVQATEEVIQNWQYGKTLTILPELNEITIRVILKAIFGLHEGESYDQLKEVLRQFIALAVSPLIYSVSFYPKLLKRRGWWHLSAPYELLRKRVDDLLYQEIRLRRQTLDPNRPDIFTLLLLATDEAGQPLSDEEVRDELVTLLLAGHDSSSATIAWALYWIHTDAKVLKKLVQEFDQLPADADPLTIVRLPYLSAVCSESLRLRSAGPAIFARITTAPVKIQNYCIEPGTIVYPCQYLTHHREDLFPEPRRFKPERFLERQYGASEYYPFGGSDRRCIGGAFALYEMKLVIATILRRYELVATDHKPVKAVRRGINIAPETGVKLRILRSRSSPSRRSVPTSMPSVR